MQKNLEGEEFYETPSFLPSHFEACPQDLHITTWLKSNNDWAIRQQMSLDYCLKSRHPTSCGKKHYCCLAIFKGIEKLLGRRMTCKSLCCNHWFTITLMGSSQTKKRSSSCPFFSECFDKEDPILRSNCTLIICKKNLSNILSKIFGSKLLVFL